ncbi:MAG: hypothetical protein K2N39_12690, partial [Lachnospiraceae bacterium]|nr:hypothetical protein [Lachnospiraceae bacterium]
MKLNYFELLSPDPVQVPSVGGVKSPTLREISSLGLRTYRHYLAILSLDLASYLSMTDTAGLYSLLSDEEKAKMTLFDLLLSSPPSCALIQNMLDFFMEGAVTYSESQHAFLICNDNGQNGMITRENYLTVCDLIGQRNYLKRRRDEDLSKVKSKKALEIMKKLQKGRAEKEKLAKTDKNMELGNIISAVANRSQSLHILNIWDLTVYQLWDCFARLSGNNLYISLIHIRRCRRIG